ENASRACLECGVGKKAAGGLRVTINENVKIMKSQQYIPNKKTARLLDRLLKDAREGKNMAGPFNTAEEMIASLHSKKKIKYS
ncbi:MAG: hypothetical protein AAB629_00765, partial [Patescibacteria group bacterium]